MSESQAAVIYARVSTGLQSEGTSLEDQAKACQRLATNWNLAVAGVFQDIQSGTDYKSRSGLQQALKLIEAGQARLLIVFRIDRGGRDLDVLRAVRRRVIKAGGEFVTSDGLRFPDTPVGNMLFNNLGAFAEFEHQTIRERTMAGTRSRALTGRQPSRWMRPYGYHVVMQPDVMSHAYTADQLGTYIIIPTEARWVREIYRLALAGSSLRGIAEFLTAQGVPTLRFAHHWSPEAIRSILTNPVYKGSAVFGRNHWQNDESRADRGLKKKFKTLRPESEWILIPAPALVDAATWARVNEELKRSQVLRSGRTDRKYMLSGLLRCPACGHAMGGQWRPGAGYRREGRGAASPYERVYQCQALRRDFADMMGRRCTHHRGYEVGATNQAVIETLLDTLDHPAAIESYLHRREEQERKEEKDDHHAELKRELATVTRDYETTVGAQISAFGAGLRDMRGYEERLVTLSQRREALEAELAAIESRRGAKIDAATIPALAQRIVSALASWRRLLISPQVPDPEKHRVLSLLLEKVVPEDGGGFSLDWRV